MAGTTEILHLQRCLGAYRQVRVHAPSKPEVLALPIRRYHQSINQDEEGETVKVRTFEEVAGDMNLPRLPPKLQVNGR